MDDLKYWVALSRITGLGPKRFDLLENAFADMAEAWNANASALAAAGLDRAARTRLIAERARLDPDRELADVEAAGVRAIRRRAPGYPALLAEIPDPPAVLYIRGEFRDGDARAVAMVGARSPTAYGREVARRLAGDLAANRVTVVSGLARGIDGESHLGALNAGGRTIAVVASGLDTVYPPEHAGLARRIVERGALLSEYPLGVRPEARNFPRRNRLLSGLTLGTVVVEAGMKSGAMLTVRSALEQNREVFAVPGSILSARSEGTNWLIQQGAKLTTNVQDILGELNIAGIGEQMEFEALAPEDETEREVFARVGDEPVHIDEVTRACGLPSAVVSATLALMEMKGLVRQVGGMLYVRARRARAGSDARK